jgi:hypothetical protein
MKCVFLVGIMQHCQKNAGLGIDKNTHGTTKFVREAVRRKQKLNNREIHAVQMNKTNVTLVCASKIDQMHHRASRSNPEANH